MEAAMERSGHGGGVLEEEKIYEEETVIKVELSSSSSDLLLLLLYFYEWILLYQPNKDYKHSSRQACWKTRWHQKHAPLKLKNSFFLLLSMHVSCEILLWIWSIL
jgi:hypothetical protein